jgi:hypothetical protein
VLSASLAGAVSTCTVTHASRNYQHTSACYVGMHLQVSCQQLGPRERGGLVLGLDIQEATLPPKHCDDRVKVMTADARLLTPNMLLTHTKDVSGWRVGLGASLPC